jgi:hypothetical protein
VPLAFTLRAVAFNLRPRYYRRLLDPWVGDKVEVAWRGKFRLEAMDVYQVRL